MVHCLICQKLHNRRAKTCGKDCCRKLKNLSRCDKAVCSNCEKEYSYPKSKKSEVDYDLCGTCRKYKKNCKVCQKQHFRQGVTCSKLCAYELKKLAWIESCGASHNFIKNSTSRKAWESRLLETEGIVNVFQREEVKKKSIETLKTRYGSRINEERGKIFCNVSQTFLWREHHHSKYIEKFGLDVWLDKEYNNSQERNLYYMNVWEITRQEISRNGKLYLGLSYDELRTYNMGKQFRDKLSIDHKYPISLGFKNKISPLMIGCIFNLQYLKTTENSSKGNRSSIDLDELTKLYNEDSKYN